MKRLERLLFTIIFLISSVSTAGPGITYREYIVQPGDSLSEIADRVRGGHTYGKGENLEKILILNPGMDAHPIFVGQKLLVPVNDLRSVANESPSAPAVRMEVAKATSVATKVAPVATPVPTPKPKGIEAPAPVVTKTDEQPKAPVVPPAPAIAETPMAKPVATPVSSPEEVKKAVPVQAQAPAAIAPISSKPVAAAEEEDDINHRFEVKAGYQISTLSAQDNTTKSKAELNTDHDITASVGWTQQWSESFKSLFNFSLRNLEFQPSTNVSKTIVKDSKTLYGLGFSGHYLLSPKLGLEVGARYGQELFLHGLSTTTISIDSANISAVSVGLDYELFKKGSTSIGASISGSYLGGSSTDTYTIDAGSAYKGLLFIRRDRHGKLLKFEVGAQQRNQNTSVSDLSETSVFGNVIYGFDLFSEEKRK
ncbi:LysM peptidoglycan-binding domain-containing protein [Bdellovibrio sp. SKB1291214]|uniref:LysM peptidoglycan-binding domain-containing protein n=1 Tax=Bdellovibrio sp. SKB1291214 TaxID=1732569 RepID=UPI000B51B878|nr:LysM domain-containing protein [Bdellovibrio sp. SKB1291214]UYL09155.1 LysM peptidoglycan-binding domain-containing protein [Bdellovibrio sp. SKB1291214]